MTEHANSPLALIILDGWGYREERKDNAIANADTPIWDRLWQDAPHTLVSGSGLDVGLPEGQMGNSEVGHMSLGAGRVVYQSMTRIDKAIADTSFQHNETYNSAIDLAVKNNKAVHLFGLVSPGGVHSHERHLVAAIELAHQRGARHVYLHAFLDGRDTPPRSAEPSLKAMDAVFERLQCGRVATVVGRYYAMDRDQRWDRVAIAYDMLTAATAPFEAESASSALYQAYERGEDDEFVQATVVRAPGEALAAVSDGDAVLFMNFRADRARQLTRAFVEDKFAGFPRQRRPELSAFVMTTQYAADINASCAFPPSTLVNGLPEFLADNNRTQLRIAETEKYAHVTFFFSGGREELYEGEDRILIDSPQVATYDLQPAMSAREVTDEIVAAIESGKYDLIVCNYANGDMVGHTGNYAAAMEAVSVLDECLGRVEAALLGVGGEALVTADHGNCEQMMDYVSGQNHTQHTTEHVPLVYIGQRTVHFTDRKAILADVAPTLLALMDLKPPPEMTGISLLELN